LAEYCQAVEDAGVRLDRLTKLVVETAVSWSMAEVMAAYQAMRCVAFMTAVTLWSKSAMSDASTTLVS